MVFYPQPIGLNNLSQAAVEQILTALSDAGFLGDFFTKEYANETNEVQSGYLIGSDFLQLITFLGCAPHIEIVIPEEASAWKQFCHIEIQQYQQSIYYKGLNNPKCSCPHCTARVAKNLPDSFKHDSQWQANKLYIECPKCHEKSLVENLNWRHSGGFGAFFIVVNSIYPNEAVPTEKLLQILQQASKGVFASWDYFYSEN
ncbi:hypothetical protein [sulfur-oxidizing endosymbiont of Gigantopelta aegis]|uniref:hypothetical protein n=1 Tax=sulfur-oxidizing endosymbiont of Gigantopelta aegis TaxID=2794934 RepID=UPI001BE4296A|nr:hypothetical protein [sulfur-oxidizing endosymbiont of Gigantopelta aegis]